MAYETGTATDPVNLLDKLRIFCIAQGITVNEYRAEGAAPGQMLSVSFNGGFFTIGFVADSVPTRDMFQMTQASGWNAATAWGSQPNETTKSVYAQVVRVNSLPRADAISTYHFSYFAGGVVMVSMLTSIGAWRHFCFGSIEKYGTYTGGAIIMGHWLDENVRDVPYSTLNVYFGMNPSNIFTDQRGGYIRVDDATGIKFRKLGTAGTIALDDRMVSNMNASRGFDGLINGTSPSGPTQASSLHPIAFAVPLLGSSVKHVPIGILRDIRFCNIQYLNNEQVFDTNWLAFCQGVKMDPDARPGTENSGYLGIAVKVI